MNKTEQFTNLEDYLNKLTQPELSHFGKNFPYQKYLNFILKCHDQNEKFFALKILSIATMSKKADYNFFTSPELIQLCNELINDQNYRPYILTILYSGSIYEDFATEFLESNICEFLINCPITYHVSIFISNLTWFENEYLEKLLEIIYNIFNDQVNKKDQIDHKICCYAFKAIHHIYNWDNIDPSIIDEINDKFTPLFYTLFPFTLNFETDENLYLNSIFRYMGHLNNVPIEFGNLILQTIKKIKNTDIIKKAKTVKFAFVIFINNFENWFQEYQEELLVVAFTYFENVPYNIKLTIFDAVLLYYDCVEGVIDQFMPTVVDWCLTFVNDEQIMNPTLKKLVEICSVSKNNVDITSAINSQMNVFEEIASSDKINDENIVLVEQLIDLLKKG